jgi:hedgehog interacting protein
LERELILPLLCKDYCKEFFYTCRGHIPGNNTQKRTN